MTAVLGLAAGVLAVLEGLYMLSVLNPLFLVPGVVYFVAFARELGTTPPLRITAVLAAVAFGVASFAAPVRPREIRAVLDLSAVCRRADGHVGREATRGRVPPHRGVGGPRRRGGHGGLRRSADLSGGVALQPRAHRPRRRVGVGSRPPSGLPAEGKRAVRDRMATEAHEQVVGLGHLGHHVRHAL